MANLSRIIIFLLFTSTRFISFGQLCTGSLGDPVVNITFGNGSSSDTVFTPPAAYTFTTSACPRDGSYTLTKTTSGCFNGNWHTVNSDHTGNGNFMLVNASFEPGDFFKTKVSNLCPNTTYEFASWILNVLRAPGITPDLTFQVEKEDGTVLGQFSTGPVFNLSSPVWKQYGFFFTTPADNPVVVIRITNNAPGGNGNDLALDDITFRPCGPAVTATIQGVNGDINLCEKDQQAYTFEAGASAAYISPAYQWQVSTDSGVSWNDIPGANGSTFTRNPAAAGHYWYRFAVTESGAPKICRINSNNLVMNIWPKPLADAGPDRVLILGDSITMKARSDSDAVFSWNPPQYLSDPAILTPKAFPPSQITYHLFVTSIYGCTNEDFVTIKVVDNIYIPNAFTPNNDGKNDNWRIPYLDSEWGASVKIFNRYGQQVYQGEGPSISWDGKREGEPQSAGVYVYILKMRLTGAVFKGTITLIR